MRRMQTTLILRRKWLIVPVTSAAVGLAIGLSHSMRHSGHVAGARSEPTGPAEHGTAARVNPIASRSVPQQPACQVSYDTTNWPGQFAAKVTVRNIGKVPLTGWTISFTFPGDQAISSAWNADFTQTGPRVSARHQNYYDASIAPGASRSLGFLGTWASNDSAPQRFSVNGIACK